MASEPHIQFSTLDEKNPSPTHGGLVDPNKPPEYPGSSYTGQPYVVPPYYGPPTGYPPPPGSYPPPPGSYPPPPGSYPPPPGSYPPPQPAQRHIRSYLVWSILNIFFGLLIFGCVAVVLSWLVIRYRRRQDYYRAKRYSRLAFIVNIICAIISIPIWIVIFYYAATNNRQKP